QRAILLENHRHASSGKRTRHINIRYFFIKDRVEMGELRIEYCPTEQMLSDVLTKGLGGVQFRFLRNRLLNLPDNHPLFEDSQECVETSSEDVESEESKMNPEPQVVHTHVARVINDPKDESENEWIVVKSRNRQRRADEARNSAAHTVSRI
ncbi:MAG: Ty1/Copia family ribonuclease HI, partial [Armatimonadota bacterium]